MNAIEEATIEVAEYMGGPYIGDACDAINGCYIPMDYCKKDYVCGYCKPISTHYLFLDALVPVWNKLELVPMFKQGRLSKSYWCKLESIHPFAMNTKGFCSNENHETMAEAGLLATAIAIRSLK